jgi:hypothetical protein
MKNFENIKNLHAVRGGDVRVRNDLRLSDDVFFN